jgi:predicted membrane protein
MAHYSTRYSPGSAGRSPKSAGAAADAFVTLRLEAAIMTDAELMTTRDNITPQLVIGLAIMAAGILMSLDVAGLIHARDYLRYWPVVLIILGALSLANATEGSGRTGGVIQLGLGLWFLLISLRVMPRHAWMLFWPLVLIFFGATLVMHTIRRPDRLRLSVRVPGGDAGSRPADARDTIHMVGVLGGSNQRSYANPFRGGELMAFLGGGRIDLRNAVIPPGGEATIDLLCVMGGYEIVVPETWRVDDRTTAILGGNGNETRPNPDASAVLVLRGFLMMGGCGIKN